MERGKGENSSSINYLLDKTEAATKTDSSFNCGFYLLRWLNKVTRGKVTDAGVKLPKRLCGVTTGHWTCMLLCFLLFSITRGGGFLLASFFLS